MKTIYITEAQKKKIKKAIAAQDQVGGKVNAGVMDAVAHGGGMCESIENGSLETWYRGYNSKYGSNYTHLLWLTDDIDYARVYGNRIEEITLDMSKISPISLYELDDFCDDYYNGPDEEGSENLMSEGYNCYFFYANNDGSYCMCLWDNTPIVSRRELSKEEYEKIEGYPGYDMKNYDDIYEGVEDDKYELGAEKGMSPYYHVTEGIEPNRMVDVQQLIRSNKFKAWFGDWENDPQNASKVVNKNGIPLIVHHGSPKFIGDKFDKGRTGRSLNYGEHGIFCTTQDISWAKRFSYPITQGHFLGTVKPDYSMPGDVLSGFVNLRNPLNFFHLTDADWKNIFDIIKNGYMRKFATEDKIKELKMMNDEYKNHQGLKHFISSYNKEENFGKVLRKYGYDGYIALMDNKEDAIEYCFTEPNQFKSIYSLSFDALKDSIYEGKKKAVKNDEGKAVPEKCDKCGGDVVLQIHGEPIYVCKVCGKYFGTMPFNLNENIENNSYYHVNESLDELDLYHGTNADFDKFDENFYLTGIGEMTYGWGVYLSNSINTAKEYGHGGQIMTVEVPDGKYLDSRRISKSEASKIARAFYKFFLSSEHGQVYKGSEKEFWDYECSCLENVPDGSYLYGTISTFLGSDKEASEWLHSIGYVGLRFPGHNSNTGEKFMNYVIFDANDVKIIKKEQTKLHENNETKEIITLYHGVNREGLEFNLEKGGFVPRVCSEGGPKAVWLSEKQYDYEFTFAFDFPKSLVEQLSNVDYIFTSKIGFNDFNCRLVKTSISSFLGNTVVETNILDDRISKLQFRYFPDLGITLWKEFKQYPNILETYINPFIEKYQTLSESKKKVVKNDKGEVVPDTCDKCGGEVVMQIHGEPVYICKDCGKYFGTVPFTLKENIESEIVNPEDVDLSSFNIKKNLNPKFWKNGVLDSRIRMKLLDIADDFIEFLGVDWAKPEDITMTGSLANFNWDENYSDIDLHIIMDYSDVDERTDFVSNYFYSQKKLWNEEHSDITIMGYPVEVFVQDVNERHDSSGVYSLEKNKWLIEPEREKLVSSKVNKAFIKDKVSEYMNKIDKLEYLLNKSKDDEYRLRRVMEKSDNLFNKIKGERKIGFERSGGKEINNYNIVFKALRRNGYIEKLVNVKSIAYDKLNSLQ